MAFLTAKRIRLNFCGRSNERERGLNAWEQIGLQSSNLIVRKVKKEWRICKPTQSATIADVVVACGEACNAATGRNGVEVAHKDNRHVAVFFDFVGDAARLLFAVARIERVKVRIANPNHLSIKDKWHERESTGGKKCDSARQKVIDLNLSDFLKLGEHQVFVAKARKANAMRDDGAITRNHAIVVALTIFAINQVADAENPVKDFLQTDHIILLAMLMEPLCDVIRVGARVVKKFDALRFLDGGLRK